MSEREETEEEGKIVEEDVYTIPLKQAWRARIKGRAPRGVKLVRNFVKKHAKADDPIITQEVNEYLWKRGVEGLPRSVRVRVTKDEEGVVKVRLVKGE